MAPITLYTTQNCRFCVVAKALLERRGLSFTEKNLARDPEGRAELAELTGMMTFPQVMVGDELIGGYQDLLRADQEGRLQELSAAAR
jgi:glutaredoxin 3